MLKVQTHESYIAAIAAIVRARLDSDEDRAKLDAIKLAYGQGPLGVRGVTYYRRWKAGAGDCDDCETHPFVEICAGAESSPLQVACTTIHEIGHVLAGYEAAHGPEWKAACARAGLRRALAAGQSYCPAALAPDVRMALFDGTIPFPTDGAPVDLLSGMLGRGGRPVKVKPCGFGVGARGGKSRGAGSGSRLIKVSCVDCGYVARVSAKWLDSVGEPLCPDHGAMVRAE